MQDPPASSRGYPFSRLARPWECKDSLVGFVARLIGPTLHFHGLLVLHYADESNLAKAVQRELLADCLQRAAFNALQQDDHVSAAGAELTFLVASLCLELVGPLVLLACHDTLR